MPIKHEVDLTTYETENGSVTEILAALNSGKTYRSDPESSRAQSAQKGETCWYYALNYIRKRYGSGHRPNADRHVEKIISEYRKALTAADIFALNNEFIMTSLPDISYDKLKVGQFERSLLDKRKLRQQQSPALDEKVPEDQREHINYLERLVESQKKYYAEELRKGACVEKYWSFFMTSKDLCLLLASSNEEKRREVYNLICEHLLSDLPKEMNTEQLKKSFLDKQLAGDAYHKFAQILLPVDEQDEPLYIKESKIKIAIFVLAQIEVTTKLLPGDNENLELIGFKDAVRVLTYLMKIDAIKSLFRKLDLKADAQFFEQILATGVYNTGALRLVKHQATVIAECVNLGGLPPMDGKNINAYLDLLDNCYSMAHIYAYSQIVNLYDLKRSSWNRKKGFIGLTEAINENGALVMVGCDIGKPAYTSPAQILLEKENPVMIGSRTIHFWSKEALKPIRDDSKSGHAIVVIGTREVKRKNDVEQYVFFLDPNDASVPNEQREVYRMSYEDFSARICLQSGVKITDPNNEPDDALYAISARHGFVA